MRKRNTIGLILILIGIAWIVDLTGLIHVNWSESFRTLWPVILIAIGISMIAGRYKFITVGTWVLTFVLFFGYGIYNRNELSTKLENEIVDNPNPVPEIKKTPADKEILFNNETEEGELILQLGAVKINVAGGADDLLAHLDTNIPNVEQQLDNGKQAVLKYIQQEYKKSNVIREFDLQINPLLPWKIDAGLAVVDGKLDLDPIPLRQLDLKLGAGDLDLVIGKKQEHSVLNIQAGATNLDIYIPENVGLMVKSGKVLTNLSFRNLNMTNRDNIFISDNYENASHKIEIHIQSAVSAIEIFAE